MSEPTTQLLRGTLHVLILRVLSEGEAHGYEILKRFENIEVLEEPDRIPSSFVHGYSKMMVRVTPK